MDLQPTDQPTDCLPVTACLHSTAQHSTAAQHGRPGSRTSTLLTTSYRRTTTSMCSTRPNIDSMGGPGAHDSWQRTLCSALHVLLYLSLLNNEDVICKTTAGVPQQHRSLSFNLTCCRRWQAASGDSRHYFLLLHAAVCCLHSIHQASRAASLSSSSSSSSSILSGGPFSQGGATKLRCARATSAGDEHLSYPAV